MSYTRAILMCGVCLTGAVGGTSAYAAATGANGASMVPAGQAQEDAASQDPESGASRLDEIVVTAQRRDQRLQDVPIAVSAVTAQALAAKGLTNTIELAQVVPGLSFTTTAGNTQVRMRGIGTSSFGPGIENPVATYIDDVYIASTAGSMFSLANIERVEALKGPQGTLFGRNATGGLVQIITRDPDQEFSGLLRAGLGNYQTRTVDSYVTGPLSDTVAADLAVHYSGMGEGYGTNVNTGTSINRTKSDVVLRSKVKFTPTDDLAFVLTGDYGNRVGSEGLVLQQKAGLENIGFYERYFTNRLDANPANDLPLIDHGGFYDQSATLDPRGHVETYGVSLSGRLDLGDLNLQSITAYRATDFDIRFDIERVPQAVLGVDGTRATYRQFSQEFKASGSVGKLDYTGGVYYFHSEDRYDPFALTFGQDLAFLLVAPGVTTGSVRYNSFSEANSLAGYAQATYEIAPGTNLTVGGRYTHEERSAGGTQSFIANFGGALVPLIPVGTPYLPAGTPTSITNENFSYRVALDRKFGDNILAYVSYNTGFKSGGYNLSVPANPPFLPEELSAVEVGLKTEFFDRRVRLNLSAYDYDYSNIQVNNFVSTSQFISNGPKASIRGIEGELDVRVAQGLTFNGSVAYTRDRFTDYPLADYTYLRPGGCDTSFANTNIVCKGDATGNKLPGTPTFTATAGVNYERSLGNGWLGASANLFHSTGFYGTTDNDPRVRQRDYQVLNANVHYEFPNDGPRVSLWGKNLLDQQYVSNIYISAAQVTYQAAPPLTWGITIEQRF